MSTNGENKVMVNILSIIFLLEIAISANSERCLSSEEVIPCVCQNEAYTGNIRIKCFNEDDDLKVEDLTIPMKTLVGKKNVEIEIEKFDLTNVPLNIFSRIGVKKLDIHSCVVPSVTEENQVILAGLENSLEELTIIRSISEDNNLSKLRFGHLQKLKKLEFYRNRIPEVHAGWFENSKLEVVKLVHNNIEKVEDRAFASLSKLRIFEFRGDEIDVIKRSMLPDPADYLINLELDYNSITSFDEDMFSNMPALKEVWLLGNKLSTLDRRTWEPVWEQLTFINLNENPIQCDSAIEWTFALRQPMIFGKCEGPHHLKGEKIEDFIDGAKERLLSKHQT